jgi:hypothetical protein
LSIHSDSFRFIQSSNDDDVKKDLKKWNWRIFFKFLILMDRERKRKNSLQSARLKICENSAVMMDPGWVYFYVEEREREGERERTRQNCMHESQQKRLVISFRRASHDA